MWKSWAIGTFVVFENQFSSRFVSRGPGVEIVPVDAGAVPGERRCRCRPRFHILVRMPHTALALVSPLPSAGGGAHEPHLPSSSCWRELSRSAGGWPRAGRRRDSTPSPRGCRHFHHRQDDTRRYIRPDASNPEDKRPRPGFLTPDLLPQRPGFGKRAASSGIWDAESFSASRIRENDPTVRDF